MRCNCRRRGGNALSGWAQAATNGGIEPRSDLTLTLPRLTSPRRRWFGPSSSGSRPSRCTSCNRFGRTCTSCTCIRVRVRVRPSRRAEQPQGAPHAPTMLYPEHRRGQPRPDSLPVGDRPPPTRDYDWAPNLQPTTRFGQAVGASQGSACRPFSGSRRPCSRRRAPAHRCSRYTTTRRRCPRAR